MQLANLTWPAVKALPKTTPVVFPVAALEQHGPHLPLFTDSLLLGEIIRRAELVLEKRVLFAPLMWLGNSAHHLDFPGTLSASPRVYLDLLGGLIENFIQHGFVRLVFLNGHGGNDVPGKQAIFEARQRHRDRSDLLLLFATYWQLHTPRPELGKLQAPERKEKPRGARSPFCQVEMGHACEWETSMMLQLAPELVGDFKKLPAISLENHFGTVARAWITKDRSKPGYLGMPAHATPQKGEALFEAFSQDSIQLLEKILAWHGKSWSQ